jgi:transcriptional/translational regulatory protein YebC/TACO1
MSGHSKWSTIKRQKGVNDAKRGAMFTKVAREVAVAARSGGGDPDANYRLRLAIEKARAVNMPEVRSIFVKAGGQLAGSGAVAWQFEPRGLITVASGDPDEVALAAIDAGAEDVDTAADPLEIFTAPADLERVRRTLEESGVAVESAESAMIAKQTVELDSSRARQALRLVELLEELEDVQRVTANFDIPEDVFAEVAG